jgi:hypothetical protein
MPSRYHRCRAATTITFMCIVVIVVATAALL